MRLLLLAPALIATLLLPAALMLTACGEDEVAAQDFVKSDAPRAAADPAALEGGGAVLDAFTADLYGILSRDPGNVVFSPYSAMIALAMTRAGASGQTLDEMNTVLHAVAAGDLDAALNAIDQALAERPGEYPHGDEQVTLDLSTANQLFAQQGFPFEDAFLRALAGQYGAGVRLVDYEDATEDARQKINAWVAEQTRDRIPELIAPGVLTADSRLVLTNAIYLNAPWRHRFDPKATKPGDFTRLDGSVVQAQMMRMGENLRYASAAGYEAVELPYVDGSLSMLLIVPKAGEFPAFQSSFGPEVLADVLANLGPAEVNLAMPKFEFRTEASLKEALIELGMPVPFDPEAADFSKMSPQGEDMFIQDVVHEAFIAVDEEGTEAAAATAVLVGVTSAPGEFVDMIVDRPFLFLVRDSETGATLFMGQVVDPAG
jgi:serpin B